MSKTKINIVTDVDAKDCSKKDCEKLAYQLTKDEGEKVIRLIKLHTKAEIKHLPGNDLVNKQMRGEKVSNVVLINKRDDFRDQIFAEKDTEMGRFVVVIGTSLFKNTGKLESALKEKIAKITGEEKGQCNANDRNCRGY
jgi:hypothetical protein